jgi:hypothetical protein
MWGLEVSQPNWPPQPVTRIALILHPEMELQMSSPLPFSCFNYLGYFSMLVHNPYLFFSKRVQEYEQIVVTPIHPGVEVTSAQLNE